MNEETERVKMQQVDYGHNNRGRGQTKMEPTLEELEDEMIRLSNEIEKQPSMEDMWGYGNYGVKGYLEEFGGWEEAVECILGELNKREVSTKKEGGGEEAKTGVGIKEENSLDEDKMIKEIQKASMEIGRPPKSSEAKELTDYYYSDYYEVFGGWENLMNEAKVPYEDPRGLTENKEYTDDELIEDLQRLAMGMGRTPRAVDMNRYGSHAYDTYRSRFGKWEGCLEEAQIPHSNDRRGESGGSEFESEKLIEEVQRVALKLGRVPTGHEVTEHSEYPYIEYYREFGTWDNVLRIAEIEEEGHEKTVIGVNQHGSRLEENDD